MNKHKSKYTSIYDRLISHPRLAWGLFIGFLIFTILVYAFKSYPFVGHIYEYINYWALPLSAAFMLVLAYMAYISITEGRRIRDEDRELESKKRRLEEVQNWIYGILKIKSECASTTGTSADWLRRRGEIRVILSNIKYIEMEAYRLDFDFTGKTKLVDKIGRLSYILEHTDAKELSYDKTQLELEQEITEALTYISNFKDTLKL